MMMMMITIITITTITMTITARIIIMITTPTTSTTIMIETLMIPALILLIPVQHGADATAVDSLGHSALFT